MVVHALNHVPQRSRPEIVVQPVPNKAWQFALANVDHKHLVCITGSFFLAAELRSMVIASLSQRHDA